jgi:hypothetical protein
MDIFHHLLAKHGVLTTFNIAKHVKQSDVRKLRNELKKTCKNQTEMEEKLQQMVVLQMRNSIHVSDIPGLVVNKPTTPPDKFKNIPIKIKKMIVGMAAMFNKTIQKEKLNKELTLILIQILLMENKITNTDVKSFIKKYKLTSLTDQDYVNDGDDNIDDESFDEDDHDHNDDDEDDSDDGDT